MSEMAPFVPHAVSAATFIVIFLLLIGIHQYARQKARSRDLVEKLKGYQPEKELFDQEQNSSTPMAALRNRVVGTLGQVGQRVGPKETAPEYSKMRMRFLRAGLRGAGYLPLFWGVKCLLMLCLPATFLLIKTVTATLPNANLVMLITLLLAMAGFYLPDLWLTMRVSRRKNRIFEGVPDALDLLVVCVEAGMGLDAAMNRIGEEMQLANPPLSDELRIYNLEMRAGKPRQEALSHLAARIDLDDFSSLSTLLIQTDKFGTSLAQALRVYSDTFRTKRYIKAEEIAAKLPTKLMVPLIFFIFPGLFVVILGPAVIRIAQVISTLF
ncbi:MAG: type II secretion system F family protein [bacterium]